MFGTVTHPTIANDLPLTVELLSPADRPIQITNDLPGFWSGSWAVVRKELAGRYPKHQWPADPSTAVPKRLKERPTD
jgi:ATP-dependent helicase HrpB